MGEIRWAWGVDDTVQEWDAGFFGSSVLEITGGSGSRVHP